jgi:hypothetical protein
MNVKYTEVILKVVHPLLIKIYRRIGRNNESQQHFYFESYAAIYFGTFISSHHQADKIPKVILLNTLYDLESL